MSRPEWSRRQILTTLSGLGSWSALTLRHATAQDPALITIDNQYRIKAKLLFLLPDFMTWDVLEKQKSDVSIAVITHGDARTDFRNEIQTETMKVTPGGRKVNWVLYDTARDLLNAPASTAARWHIIFVMRKNEEVVLDDLNKLDARFGQKQGVVFVTEENTKFRNLAALNFWEDVASNRIRIQLRHKYLHDTIGVTPKKELLAIDGVILYDKPAPVLPAQR